MRWAKTASAARTRHPQGLQSSALSGTAATGLGGTRQTTLFQSLNCDHSKARISHPTTTPYRRYCPLCCIFYVETRQRWESKCICWKRDSNANNCCGGVRKCLGQSWCPSWQSCAAKLYLQCRTSTKTSAGSIPLCPSLYEPSPCKPSLPFSQHSQGEGCYSQPTTYCW